ncbi:hypothetical protein ACFE04_001023 [Oxalis oulophora]
MALHCNGGGGGGVLASASYPSQPYSRSSLLKPSTTTTTTTTTTTNNKDSDNHTKNNTNDDANNNKVSNFTYSRASPSIRWPNLKFTNTQLPIRSPIVESLDFSISNSNFNNTQLLISPPNVESVDFSVSGSNSSDTQLPISSRIVESVDFSVSGTYYSNAQLPIPSQNVESVKFSVSGSNSSNAQLPISSPIAESVNFSASGNDTHIENLSLDDAVDGGNGKDDERLLGRVSRKKVKLMNKLALKRAKDWRLRVKFLTDKILGLRHDEFVADVLDEDFVQMTPTDFCFVVKWVGQESWQRALEVYEWLNLRRWYSPNARMLATIVSILGKANQEGLAVEIFTRAEPAVGDTVQVYNSMMGVYARTGKFKKVQELLDLMRERGCTPDLVSFNTLINARFKVEPMVDNLGVELLDEVRRSKLRPDTITYNTLISACSRDSNLDEATKIFNDMEVHKCQPDLWTYNAMISVYARCGYSDKAEQLFKELESKGFFPDAVTYNSLLYAFAREGNLEKVKSVWEEMVKAGFGKDEMTYNTIIHMYGKQGKNDLALQLYRDMKTLGRHPDVVTYTVLIDSLGKANKITEAAQVMSEMLDSGIKPTVRTYSALIHAYAKSGMLFEAEEAFDCMIRSGIKPDHIAYSVMLDIFLKFNETKKSIGLYKKMVADGFTPDRALYEIMIRALTKENKMEEVEKIVIHLKELCGLNTQAISFVLAKGECYDHAAKMLKLAIRDGYELDHENLLSILSSYSLSGRYSEAYELLEFLKEHAPGSKQLIMEALIVILCKDRRLDSAMEEYGNFRQSGFHSRSYTVYDSLLRICKDFDFLSDASQIFSDMRLCGVELTHSLYESMAEIYCKLGFPETACFLIEEAETKGIIFENVSIYVDIIEAYGKAKLWQRAEGLVGGLRKKHTVLDRKIWNGLLHAYAESGLYERARVIFNTMMRDGPSPTVDSINGLLQALINDKRLNELYLVIDELQDMGFKMSKTSILLMLEAFAKSGDIFEVKKMYSGMKAAGYYPTINLYRLMIKLLCKGKRVQDVEAMIWEMDQVGFKPDLSIWNSMLKLYMRIEDFRKAANVYQRIQEEGLKPDEDSYNTLVKMYCRDCRPEEGLLLMHEMKRQGFDPKLDTYKSLITAFGKQKLLEQADELFEELRGKDYKLDRGFYHIMMKIYRNSGRLDKTERILRMMKDAGVEPSPATMHLLMLSYGGSGQPEEAEKVLCNLKETGGGISSLTYGSVIDAYLKNGDYNVGIQKLVEMQSEGLEIDHRIWTCFVRAASLSSSMSEAVILLDALRNVGFDLPIRLLTERSQSLISEIDLCFQKLEPLKDNAAFNFVNAIEDLLWAFELRATALWVFQLAIKTNIYHNNMLRVAEKDWGADFRRLSGSAALVGLTLWLDHMQDASLQGRPESPKSVVLITGMSEYNTVSLNKTIKAFLWEMGSPFLPCKTRSGVLVAKGHSLRMWLKDSPFCFDLELKDVANLPEQNSMQLIEGCLVRRGLVPAFKEINKRLGERVSPKKFARFALMADDKREKCIGDDIQGRREKLEKMKKSGGFRMKKDSRRKYVGNSYRSKPKQLR